MFILNILTIFIYICIKKIGEVLWEYEERMENIRNYFYSRKLEKQISLNVRTSKNSMLNSKFFSIQKSAETILIASSIILLIIKIFGVSYIFYKFIIPIWFMILSVLFILIILILWIIAFIELYKKKKLYNKNIDWQIPFNDN